jgi:hypothetical protein
MLCFFMTPYILFQSCFAFLAPHLPNAVVDPKAPVAGAAAGVPNRDAGAGAPKELKGLGVWEFCWG